MTTVELTAADLAESSFVESLTGFLEERLALTEALATEPGPHLVAPLAGLIRRADEVERLARAYVLTGILEFRISSPLLVDLRGKPFQTADDLRDHLFCRDRGSRELIRSMLEDEFKARIGSTKLLAFPEPLDKDRAETQQTLINQATLLARNNKL